MAAVALVLGAMGARADLRTECAKAKTNAERVTACTALIVAEGTTPDVRAEAYMARANAYAESAKHTQAIDDYTKVLDLKADDAQAYYGRGQARLAGGDVYTAISDLTQAIRYNGDAPGLYITRGYAYLVNGNAQEAIADFSVAIRRDPKNASAFNNRGLAFRKKGDLDAAIKDYSTAISLNPIYALAYNNRGYVFEANGDKKAAAADFRRALSLDPSLVGAKKGLKRLGEPMTIAAETDELVAKGKALAQKNCAWCHAIGRKGDSPNPRAPAWRNLHKRHPILALRDPLSRGIARPHDEMPDFELSDGEVETIIAYINSLAP